MSALTLSKRGDVWYITGSIAGKRIRKSLGTSDKKIAEQLRVQYEAKVWKRHTYGEKAVRTFEEAALSYQQQGGESRFLSPILHFFKGRAIGSIKPAEIRAMALAVYPNGAASTRNRQAITPARSVINHGHDLGWCSAIRVKQFDGGKSTKHKPVNRDWLNAFMAQADGDRLPHLSAIVLFMNQTGARVSEAVRLTGEHIDLQNRTALLGWTKTEEMVVRHLTAELVVRIANLGISDHSPVFKYTATKSVIRRMKAVANRAGIEVRTSHSAGRHSFGTNAMNVPNASIRDAMDAGGWKSAKLFMETYVHSHEAGKGLAKKFDLQNGPIDANLPQEVEGKRYPFGSKR